MRLTEQVHLELEKTVRPGDTAIDATAGNGHDTLALARLVGPGGKVYAIDWQERAIASTRVRLEEAEELAQCALIQADHATMLHSLLPGHHASVVAITFNLGYLPGGEKDVTTLPESTLCALDAAKCLIKPDGILIVTAYRGHPGGMDEAKQVAAWMHALSPVYWQVELSEPPTRNTDHLPPLLWIARKLREQGQTRVSGA